MYDFEHFEQMYGHILMADEGLTVLVGCLSPRTPSLATGLITPPMNMSLL